MVVVIESTCHDTAGILGRDQARKKGTLIPSAVDHTTVESIIHRMADLLQEQLLPLLHTRRTEPLPIHQNRRLTRGVLAGIGAQQALHGGAVGELKAQTHQAFTACQLAQHTTELLIPLIGCHGRTKGLPSQTPEICTP